MRYPSDGLEGLSPAAKREWLAKLLKKKLVGAAPAWAPLEPHPESRHEPFPLTDVQRAYWVGRGAGLELSGVSCHMYLEFDVEHLDVARFARAFRRLVERHEMLRAIVRRDGTQQILQRVPPFAIEAL